MASLTGAILASASGSSAQGDDVQDGGQPVAHRRELGLRLRAQQTSVEEPSVDAAGDGEWHAVRASPLKGDPCPRIMLLVTMDDAVLAAPAADGRTILKRPPHPVAPPRPNARDQRPAERVRCIASLDGPPAPTDDGGSTRPEPMTSACRAQPPRQAGSTTGRLRRCGVRRQPSPSGRRAVRPRDRSRLTTRFSGPRSGSAGTVC